MVVSLHSTPSGDRHAQHSVTVPCSVEDKKKKVPFHYRCIGHVRGIYCAIYVGVHHELTKRDLCERRMRRATPPAMQHLLPTAASSHIFCFSRPIQLLSQQRRRPVTLGPGHADAGRCILPTGSVAKNRLQTKAAVSADENKLSVTPFRFVKAPLFVIHPH